MIEGLPLPSVDDPLDQPFWAAAIKGRLVVQLCDQCGETRFPPRPMCPSCQSEVSEWVEDGGEAQVWSFAAPQPPLLPAFEAMLPYVTVLGALDSHPHIRIAGMAVGADGETSTGITAADIQIGQPVQLRFRRATDESALPVWQIAP
ncbi:Zn-ribbon domain-containing OB-fold protein [Erythrobacter aurantius]|uniref:Zn-ribbon domain-containing OB-fold protein n=1 Tax=Erythrobacter aurantius TaxID=2909249 RepID=UPI00207AA139|nr:zinc ribbon domain-containing protein [Erythrobacter aurantius]